MPKLAALGKMSQLAFSGNILEDWQLTVVIPEVANLQIPYFARKSQYGNF